MYPLSYYLLLSLLFLFVSSQEGGEGGEGGGEGGEGGEGGSQQNTVNNEYHVTTQCNYIYGEEVPVVTPIDVCISVNNEDESSSYEFTCNSEGTEVSKYVYDTVECEGDGSLNATFSLESDNGDNDTVHFRCDGYDCRMLIQIYEDVSDDCTHGDYYWQEAYVDHACVTDYTSDGEEYTYSYECGVNNSVIWRIYQDDSCSTDLPDTTHLNDGCNFHDFVNGTATTTSYADHLICEEEPTRAPTVSNNNEDDSRASGIFSYYCAVFVTVLSVGAMLTFM